MHTRTVTLYRSVLYHTTHTVAYPRICTPFGCLRLFTPRFVTFCTHVVTRLRISAFTVVTGCVTLHHTRCRAARPRGSVTTLRLITVYGSVTVAVTVTVRLPARVSRYAPAIPHIHTATFYRSYTLRLRLRCGCGYAHGCTLHTGYVVGCRTLRLFYTFCLRYVPRLPYLCTFLYAVYYTPRRLRLHTFCIYVYGYALQFTFPHAFVCVTARSARFCVAVYFTLRTFARTHAVRSVTLHLVVTTFCGSGSRSLRLVAAVLTRWFWLPHRLHILVHVGYFAVTFCGLRLRFLHRYASPRAVTLYGSGSRTLCRLHCARWFTLLPPHGSRTLHACTHGSIYPHLPACGSCSLHLPRFAVGSVHHAVLVYACRGYGWITAVTVGSGYLLRLRLHITFTTYSSTLRGYRWFLVVYRLHTLPYVTGYGSAVLGSAVLPAVYTHLCVYG